MAKTQYTERAHRGNEIIIAGKAVGGAPRTAVILEVLGKTGSERFHVRWKEGHESIYFAGAGAVIRRPQRRRTKSTSA